MITASEKNWWSLISCGSFLSEFLLCVITKRRCDVLWVHNSYQITKREEAWQNVNDDGETLLMAHHSYSEISSCILSQFLSLSHPSLQISLSLRLSRQNATKTFNIFIPSLIRSFVHSSLPRTFRLGNRLFVVDFYYLFLFIYFEWKWVENGMWDGHRVTEIR